MPTTPWSRWIGSTGSSARRRAWLLLLPLIASCTDPAPDALDRPFHTWQSHRFENVQRQRTDFTCGAASLSAISEHYYGKPIKEVEFTTTIRKLYSKEEWEKVTKDGLSMLDMKRAAEAYGFSVEGLKLTLAQLKELKGPVIVHLDRGAIQHFSVFRGIDGDRAYLADPVNGNSRMPLYRFQDEWTGYVLAIWLPGQGLPATNALAVSPRDGPTELVSRREAFYSEPSVQFSPFNY